MKKIVWKLLNWLGIGAYVQIMLAGYLFDRGWTNSFNKKTPIDKSGNPIPWMTYAFVDFIEERLNKQMTVFEYGSGNSTLWFSDRVKDITSVEYDQNWFKKVEQHKKNNSTLIYKPLNNKEEYITSINSFNKKFDIIVIDGRFRNKCAFNAPSCLNTNGVIVIDNSNVAHYAAGIEYLINNGFKKIDFSSMLPALHSLGKTTVFYKAGNNILDI
jgi:hypothetical protein